MRVGVESLCVVGTYFYDVTMTLHLHGCSGKIYIGERTNLRE